MTVTRLKSGRWRSQVWHRGKWMAVADVIGGPRSFEHKKDALRAKRKAQSKLDKTSTGALVTVAEFRDRWLTDLLFARPKESTMKHNAERTKAFAQLYGDMPILLVNDDHVSLWLAGGKRNGTVPALRAMFNDAASRKAGRLVQVNPFAGLGIARTKGSKHRQPPSQQDMWSFLAIAKELTPPSFAAWLEVACFTAMRPGELDALQWTQLDWDEGDIHVTAQWNAKLSKFTEPKTGRYTIALVSHVRETLTTLKRDHDSPYVFVTTRGHHYTPSTRAHHWNRVRCAAGIPSTRLYDATRHYFGWFGLNILGLEPHVLARQFGHKDGGRLIVDLYGHPDEKLARQKIRDAFDNAGQVRPLRVVREDMG